MQKLAQGTAERLAAQGIIREEDAPIYRYGLEAMYSSLLELLSILALAALIGNFWQTVLFLQRSFLYVCTLAATMPAPDCVAS